MNTITLNIQPCIDNAQCILCNVHRNFRYRIGYYKKTDAKSFWPRNLNL